MLLNKKTPLEIEWAKLRKAEIAYLKKYLKKDSNFIKRNLEDKVPEKLQATLETAFNKAFALIFEKGTSVIEKTYNRDGLEKEFLINEYSHEVRQNRKTLRAVSKKAQSKGKVNQLISGVSGAGMGILGIGLPDIPIFTATIFKNVYEMALSFGFDYDSEEEKYFILLLIRTALSNGEEIIKADNSINEFIKNPVLPENYDRAKEIEATSKSMATELLCLKFIQGIPVVGVVGGAANALYLGRISQYAELKYRRRFYSKNLKK